LLEKRERLAAGAAVCDLIALGPQSFAEPESDVGVVLDDHDVFFHVAVFSGS
jgi:hypothetical protein